jgi:peptide/nickel transport system substrate-binding protein
MNNDGDGKPFFQDPKVRLALVQAIDRQRIIGDVLAGRADADATPIPYQDWAYSASAANLHPFDALITAKALDDAGWVSDPTTKLRSKKGMQFHITLVVADSYPNQPVAEAIAHQLLDVGVQVDVKPVPGTTLVTQYLLTHRYEMALVRVDSGPDPDQYTLWHTTSDPGALNFSYQRGWGLIDKDLEDGRNAVDPQARLFAYTDFQMLMAEAAPAVFLYTSRYDYAVSQRVHGVHLNTEIEPADRFQYVTDWYVNTSG